MGVPKTSRKGKKAWRHNISTAEVDQYLVNQDKELRAGGPVDNISNESLFFVDKTRDFSIKRKSEKHKTKVLRCESILQGSPFIKPVPSSKSKQLRKKEVAKKLLEKIHSQGQKAAEENKKESCHLFDIWNDTGNNAENAAEDKKSLPKRKIVKPIIPAVEVDLPGCSYNPSFEAHQDALAIAVANEMQKLYKRELQPKSVPKYVEGEPVDDESMCFLDVDVGMDESNDIDDNDGDVNEVSRPVKIQRLTRAELNRKGRRKEQLKVESEQMKRKKVSQDIESLTNIINDIQKEEDRREKKRIRRNVAKQERLQIAPPRLGKCKFEPEPVRVLLSEQITGSLRKLKGCNTLVRDRFKSILKRGYLAPSQKKKG